MDQAIVNEFPFVAELPKREKSKLAKLWDTFQEMKRITAETGMLVPVGLVAELLDISRQRVYQLVEAGRLQTHEFNGRVYITENSLQAWAELEHKAGRPLSIAKDADTLKGALKITKRYMAAERDARRAK